VRVLWVLSSNVWLWILLSLSLDKSTLTFTEVECSPVVGPVVVVEAGESGIWMGVDWVGTSDVWLWVFLTFLLGKSTLSFTEVEGSPVVGPVVVVEAGESGIWMSVDWVGSSDIWLWIFIAFLLGKSTLSFTEVEGSPVVGPVVVVEAGEGGIWMGVDWIGTSDIWLWVFSAFLLSKSTLSFTEVECSPVVGPVVVVEAGESRIWMGVDWVGTSNIWLWIFSSLC